MISIVAFWPLLAVTRGAERRSIALALVEGADDELELRIGEDAGERAEGRRDGGSAGDAEEERVDRVLADRQVAVAQTGGDGLRPDRVAVRIGEREVARKEGG